MRVVSHRGNLKGPGSQCERERVEEALLSGFDVEIDVRYATARIHVGHDAPLYELPRDWAHTSVCDRLWFHAKDERCYEVLATVGHRVFTHDDEPTGSVAPDGLLWVHPRLNDDLSRFALGCCVLLDVAGFPRLDRSRLEVMPFAVCTDWPFEWVA